MNALDPMSPHPSMKEWELDPPLYIIRLRSSKNLTEQILKDALDPDMEIELFSKFTISPDAPTY